MAPTAADPGAGQSRRRRSCPSSRRQARPDAIICTGRSDYPNQVNNVLCFPYIFRGALDCRRHQDQRGDEARRGATRSRSWRRPTSRGRRRGLWRRDAALRPGIPDPDAVRPAADPAIAPAVAKAAHGHRRRHAADRRLRRLPRALSRFVYRSGFVDEAGVHARAKAQLEARRLRRRRGRARAARGAGGARRGPGAADPDRPAGGDRERIERFGPAHAGRGAISSSSTRTTIRATASYWETLLPA